MARDEPDFIRDEERVRGRRASPWREHLNGIRALDVAEERRRKLA
jgi:hypothetical protein